MPPPLVQYALDPTGLNSDNLVHNEIHQLTPNRRIRAIAPIYGAYYTEGLIVTDGSTQGVLTKGVDYITVDLVPTASETYGKEICSVILVLNTNVSNTVYITYQVLGGMYTKNFSGIANYINTLAIDNRPVAWPNIIGKPSSFNPTQHLHDIGDVYGFEYITYALERIRSAILVGDNYAYDQVLAYVDSMINTLKNLFIRSLSDYNAHILDLSNPHQTDKSQVGLEYLENMRAASIADGAIAANAIDTTPINTVIPEDKYVSLRSLVSFKNTIFNKIEAGIVNILNTVQADMNTLRDETAAQLSTMRDSMNNTVSQLQTDLNNKIMKAMIGIPQPYPLTIPPTGWLVMDGQVINATKYPILASIYGANLPDLRGMFIRGWDNGKGIDSDRGLLSNQGDAIRNITGKLQAGDPNYPNVQFVDGLITEGVFATIPGSKAFTGDWGGSGANQAAGATFDASRVVPTADENRPINKAFNYICYGG